MFFYEHQPRYTVLNYVVAYSTVVLWTLWFSAIALALPLCIFDERSSSAKDVQKDLRFHLEAPILRIEGKQDRPYVLLNEMSPQQNSSDHSDHDSSMQSVRRDWITDDRKNY
jgi:hypothetical protein